MINRNGNIIVSGTLQAQSLTGSLLGTASWAITASYTLTSSFTTGTVLNAVSSSYSATASYIELSQTASYVLQSVSSSFSATASYVLNAQTASYALNAVSSSYSATASYANTLTVNGALNIESASIDYSFLSPTVTTASYQTIAAHLTGSYRAAFFDYVLFSGSSARAGTVVTTWSASFAEYAETYTDDVGGSTLGVTLQTAISASQIVLQASASAAWTIRSLVRLL